MGVNIFENGKYKDPTANQAIAKVDRENKKEIVFICSPYAGDIIENTKRAKCYARFAVSQGAVPIIPHLMYPQFLREEVVKERQLGIEMGLVLLSRCNQMWVFGDYISKGMAIEIRRAKNINKPIRYFNTECKCAGGKGG